MFIVRNCGRSEQFPDRAILAVVGLLLAVTVSATAQNSGIPQTQNFSSVAVGASSATLTLSYTPPGISTAPTFSLSYGLEFTAATPSCTTSGTISCTIGVKFMPQFAGLREDALIVKSQSGSFLGATLLYGTGLAPQMALTPGIITTIAGVAGTFGYAGDGHAATAATLANPSGVAIDPAGNVYIADSINQVIRKVTASTGVISTVAGTPDGFGFSGDGGPALSAKLNNPTGVALDGAGDLYIADQANSRIREVNAVTGVITTVAGGGNPPNGYGDGGPATNAILSGPNDVAVDAVGNLYIADSYHGLVRKVTAATGIIITLAGGGTGGGSDGWGDGAAAINAILDNPTGVAVDAAGNVYIADSGRCLIRQINTHGIINAVAGNGNQGYFGDLGPATSAELNNPTGVRVDAAGNFYIADYGANVIRQVTAASGIINTVAGTGTSSDTGDNGSATNAAVDTPWNLALDATGNIYLVDPTNNVVRKVSVTSSALPFAAVSVGLASPAQLVTVSNIGNQTLSLSALTVTANFRQQASGYADCSASSAVASGSDCFVGIASVPAVTGSFTGTLTVAGNSLNHAGAADTAALSGTGNNSPVPRVTLSPSSVSFGNQTVGIVSASQTVTLSNTGTASLAISSILLTGTNTSDFGMSTTCGTTLLASASCTVTLNFTPGATGSRSASLIFTDSVASSPQTVSITGTGTQPQTAPANASFSPSSISFPSQTVGASSSPLQLTLTNTGSSPLGLSGIALSGTNAPDFSLTTNCGGTLAPGAGCGFNLTFTPSATGARSASLTFSDTAPGSPQTIPITGTGIADPPPPPPPPTVFFTRVPGALSQIAVGADGAVWGLNGADQIFQFNSTNQSWNWIAGALSKIVVGSSTAVWGLNAEQQIYRRDTVAQIWDSIPGALAQVAIGCDGDVWGLNASGSIYHFNAASQSWQQIPGGLSHLAVGSDGAVWGLNAGNSIYRYSPSTQSFSQVSGSLTQIAVAADGDAWGLYNQSIFHFDRLSQTWTPMPGALTQIAAGSGGNVYGLNAANQVCQYNAQSQTCNWISGVFAQLAVGGNGAVWGLDGSGGIWTLNQPVEAAGVFDLLPGNFAQLAVASDGSAWALNTAGSIFEFNSATQSWIQLPGALAQLSIAPNGVVWGLNSAGLIFRFNPSTQSWSWISGALAKITVGANGDVWGLNSSGQIYLFNASSQTWTQVPGTLSQISVGADGTVWGLNAAGDSYRFDRSSSKWDRASGSFSQIAVGSKNNVWALGLQGQIYQFDSGTGVWNSIPGVLAQIRVGFDGSVWGINSAHQVFRFNSQTQGWDQISGSLAQIQIASDAVVWGLDSSGAAYRFQ